MYEDITGIILAGGKSSRMGENKALMKIGNRLVIEKLTDLMTSLFQNVIIIANDSAPYNFLQLPIYSDIFPNKGPLTGIHTGLTYSKTHENFIIPCDTPLLTPEIIRYIANFKTNKPITIPKCDGYIQQLIGRYRKECAHLAKQILLSNQLLLNNKCMVLEFIEKAGGEIIEIESLPFYKKGAFYNMNRPDDYKILVTVLNKNVENIAPK